MEPVKVLFLLDENVDHRITSVFTKIRLHYSTIQKEGWNGIKNGELSQKIKKHSMILITRDKDFVFLWKKYHIQVIYLAIQPPLYQTIIKELESLFLNWNVDLKRSFLISVQEGSLRLWYD